MKLYLIRHGETVDNKRGISQGWHDSSLTELGLKQADEAAEKLVGAKPTIIFASDLGRAQQTAVAVQKDFGGIPVLSDWRLRERMLGDAEGKNHTELDTDELRGLKPANTVKNMEPMEAFTERVLHFISDLLDFADTHQEVAIVTHNGTLNRFAYLTDEDKYQWTLYPNGDVLELELKSGD